MRTTDPATIQQWQVFRENGGVRVPTQQYAGIYDGVILDTDATNSALPAGYCRVIINTLDANTAFGPCLYPSANPPDPGSTCVLGFITNTSNVPPSIGVRILELVTQGDGNTLSPFLLMGA